MQTFFMYIWIFPFIFLAYVGTKDRVGFLSISFAGLVAWAICLASYLEQLK